jgi:hypothetical protein
MESSRFRDAFVVANVSAALCNAIVLATKLPHVSYRIPVLDPTASVLCVASFSLVVSIAGVAAGTLHSRVGYAAYVVASLVVLVFYLYAVILCFVQPEELPVASQRDVSAAGALCAVVTVLVSLACYAAARLGGRAWTAARLGALCSFVSLVVACALAGFGAQMPSSRVVLAAGVFEIVDSVAAVPIFLCGWKRMVRVHTVWSTVSLVFLVVGVIVAIRSNEYVFTQCHKHSADCSPKQLLALAGLAAVTCVTSACDLACSAVVIAKERETAKRAGAGADREV